MARWVAGARGGEEAEADKHVSHGATPFNRNLNRPCMIGSANRLRFLSRANHRALRVHDVTGLLISWRQGDAAALDR
jgi:hypothetical protein